MTIVDTHVPGTACWVELATSDLAGGRKFYEDLFGWTHAGQAIGGWGEYVIFSVADGRAAAGGYEQPDQERSMGFPPHWNVHISSDDVDKTVAKAEEAGGTTIVSGMDTPNGRMAVLADPTGAAFCVWHSETMPGFTVRDEPVSLSWTELLTRDFDAAAKFYGAVFGWTTRSEAMGDGPPYTLFGLDGKDIAGMFPPPAEEIPNVWQLYFEVADAEATVARARELGGQVMQEAMAIPGVGTFAILGDPAGAPFGIMQSEPHAG